MKIRITKELPKALSVRPKVGKIYEAEYEITERNTARNSHSYACPVGI